MKVLCIVPARMGSSRFPGKPMVEILGTPMIGRVIQSVSKSTLLLDAVVATCDEEIFDYVHSIGCKAIMTSVTHERASDRCAEALIRQEESSGTTYDLVVMVQGDEPLISPEMIDESIQPFLTDNSLNVVNLYAEISSNQELQDPNCIKVVIDSCENAMYFSRSAIPSKAIGGTILGYKQVCVIPFKRDYLIRYSKLSATPLEVSESVDMLRVLESGDKVRMVKTSATTQSVDTPDDVQKVIALMRQFDLN